MQLLGFLSELSETAILNIRQLLIVPSLAYMRLLVGFVWIPEIVDVSIYHRIVTKHWKLFPATAIAFIPIGIVWDYFAIKDGVWYFPGSIVEIWIFGMPLEDLLFTIFVSWFLILFLLFFYKVEEKRRVRTT